MQCCMSTYTTLRCMQQGAGGHAAEHQEDALEVDVDDLVEVRLGHVQEVRAAHDA